MNSRIEVGLVCTCIEKFECSADFASEYGCPNEDNTLLELRKGNKVSEIVPELTQAISHTECGSFQIQLDFEFRVEHRIKRLRTEFGVPAGKIAGVGTRFEDDLDLSVGLDPIVSRGEKVDVGVLVCRVNAQAIVVGGGRVEWLPVVIEQVR